MQVEDTSWSLDDAQRQLNSKRVDIVSLRPSGRLMDWASKSRPSEKEEIEKQSPENNDLIELLIPQKVMSAIEESLNTDIDSSFPGSTGHSEQLPADDCMSCDKIIERIWLINDQKASIFLQERLRLAVPGEFEHIIGLILQNANTLMKHRFGNFLVQCMLEVAHPEDIAYFADHLTERMAEMSKHQFGCHVIQRLLDVSPLVIKARVAAELLHDVVNTMTSPFGTHVWQKLLRIPWASSLPSITSLTNNAVHLEPHTGGWLAIAKTEAGCATIKSFISVGSADGENQECIEELLDAIPELIISPVGSSLIPRLAAITSSRARTMTSVFSRAYEYCRHSVASTVIIILLKMKIPSFPVRLGAAIAPYYNELLHDKNGAFVIETLESIQKYRF